MQGIWTKFTQVYADRESIEKRSFPSLALVVGVSTSIRNSNADKEMRSFAVILHFANGAEATIATSSYKDKDGEKTHLAALEAIEKEFSIARLDNREADLHKLELPHWEPRS